MAVKKAMTTNDLAAVHSQYKTFRQANPDENSAYAEAGKTEKGQKALGWYLAKVSGGRLQTSSQFVGTKHRVLKTEQWLTQKQADDGFGVDLQFYVESGRVQWREALGVPGCYEFLDTQNLVVTKHLEKSKEHGQHT